MTASLRHRLDIQGLRAIAVLAVMAFHYNSSLLPGGFVGVDVFFVISGYLIVNTLFNKRIQPEFKIVNTLLSFYLGRIKRIFPAYYAMLILVSLLAAALFLPQDFALYKKSMIDAVYFISNDFFASFSDYFAPTNYEQPLLHTWSLAVEAQFYLLVPLFVLILPVKVLKWVFAISLIALTGIAQYRLEVLEIRQATYYSLYARIPEFFAGGLAALHMQTPERLIKPWLGSLGLVIVLLSAMVQPYLGAFPGLSALLPVLGTILILLHPAGGQARKWLISPILVWVGQLSYSFYLWHWPVLAFLHYYSGSKELGFSSSLIFISFTLFLTILSFYCIEAPLRLRRGIKKQALGYGFLLCAILATGASVSAVNEVLTPAMPPLEYRRYADQAIICHGQVVGDCFKGDIGSSKEVLVLGDSHAAMLNNFFDQLGKSLGFKSRIITASSCVTIPGFDYRHIAEGLQKPCLDQIHEAKKYLSSAKIIFLAASWNWQFNSENFNKALNEFVDEQSRAGKTIYIIEQEPLLKKSPIRAIRFKEFGFDVSMGIDPAYLETNDRLRKIAKKYENVNTLNFESTGVFNNAPFFDGIPIYMDEHHINEVGVKHYAAAARSTFKKIME